MDSSNPGHSPGLPPPPLDFFKSQHRGSSRPRPQRWAGSAWWEPGWGAGGQSCHGCVFFSRTPEMKGLLTLAWFLACGVPAVPGSLLDLKSMIEKVTGKNALTNYGFYGCYCGWGGRGTPMDGTDWCCWVHDKCYGRLEERACNIRTQSYKYRFARGLVTCGKPLPSRPAHWQSGIPAALGNSQPMCGGAEPGMRASTPAARGGAASATRHCHGATFAGFSHLLLPSTSWSQFHSPLPLPLLYIKGP
uniref:Phospholipase A2 n=1 Tax=Oryctolagus cuniculus TaxID=9986 RepID=G1SUZ8_RABIT